MYRPHLALPLAASLIVIPLEQDVKKSKNVTASNKTGDFFIVVGLVYKRILKERFFKRLVVNLLQLSFQYEKRELFK